MVVHEMIHHLQSTRGLNYNWPGAREKRAYEAQGQWLELFGTNLAAEFDLDSVMLLVKMHCME
jgi:hypothetical protein